MAFTSLSSIKYYENSGIFLAIYFVMMYLCSNKTITVAKIYKIFDTTIILTQKRLI